MKSIVKVFALVLALTMFMSLFASCAQKQESDVNDAKPTTTEEKETEIETGKKEEAKPEKKIFVGISLPTQREQRWVWDRENFEKLSKELNVDIAIQIADNDAAKQQSQCENLLSQGIDVLIIAPHDGKAAANIVAMAHEAGVKVISYDRLILDTDVDLYLTFDQEKIGEIQGEWLVSKVDKGNIVLLSGDPADSTSVPLRQGALNKLQPKIDSGDYKIVLDQAVRDWQPSEALKHMENALTATNNDIQGVIAPNDGTAGACIQALAAQGLAGKVPVTGMDAEVDALKRIIEGTQGMTVFTDIRDLARGAMESAIKLVKGEEPDVNNVMNNGKIDVPSIFIEARLIEKDDIKPILIDGGFIKEEDLK
ncbi:MAG TPA: sugar ABC transporter substrate-binding protein [Clostridiaceae bacterium]|nr:sugar ABC transporter substrate-binding protein [Clostridiaceae bacterium]